MAIKEVEIHGHKVKYDDDDPYIEHAVHHLSQKLDSSEAKPFFDEAHRDLVHHKAHFEFRDHDRHVDRNATLFHTSDGYELKLRDHGIFK